MKRKHILSTVLTAISLTAALHSPMAAHAQARTLKVVPHANLTVLDPVWTTAFITRNHGYMIYDTLFGTDLQGQIKPQMVDKWSVSKDNLLWTFTLRDDLEFHDGKPVTSEDAVASLKRWGSRDSFGGALLRSIDTWATPDAKTFTITLNAFRRDAGCAGQAVVQRAFHHARPHCRHTRHGADQGAHWLRPL